MIDYSLYLVRKSYHIKIMFFMQDRKVKKLNQASIVMAMLDKDNQLQSLRVKFEFSSYRHKNYGLQK